MQWPLNYINVLLHMRRKELNMKQPKFRGFSYETNSWQYGFGWFETDYTDDYLEEKGRSKQDAILLTDSGHTVCDIESMGQCTDLKDKNEKEIYENDIANREIFAFGEIRTFTGTVKMFEGAWWVDSGTAAVPLWNEMHELEIVGNKYENPKLLEKAE